MSKSVLLVEDDAMLRSVGRTQLTNLGLECDVATNGSQAVELAARRSYDLILVDIRLPQVDGVNVAMHIRENEMRSGTRRVTIVAITSLDDILEHSAGLDDYLHKPVHFHELSGLLHKWGLLSEPYSVKRTH